MNRKSEMTGERRSIDERGGDEREIERATRKHLTIAL